MQAFDVVVIGTGSAGNAIATTCAQEGLRVGVVDSRPFGGTCALRGCTPKKVLVGAATLARHVDALFARGVFTAPAELSWQHLREFKESFTSAVPEMRREHYETMGISSFEGTASFRDAETLMAGSSLLTSEYYVIASGARPRTLGIPGEELLTTSEGFMEMESFPASIVCVGGGYVSFEFAHMAAQLGASVTILHRGGDVLRQFDRRVVARLLEATRQRGIRVVLNAQVREVRAVPEGLVVVAEEHSGMREYPCEPDIDSLSLESAGIEASSAGVHVNSYLQSVSSLSSYAAGDAVAGTPPLKTVAEVEAEAVAENILHGNSRSVDYRVVPSVLFTMPELASVGYTESQALANNIDFVVKETDMSAWFSSRQLGETAAYASVLVGKRSKRIIGAHVMAPRAGELINVFALAMRHNMTPEDLEGIPWGFPTATSDVRYIV
jgi:glutathione reductase (NADPH)